MNLNTIKTNVKKIGWIYGVNAWIKARQEKKVFTKTVNYYSTKLVNETPKKLFPKKAQERLKKIIGLNRKPNFFYLGTDELQDRSGILQGVMPLGALSYFTKSDGSYGQYITGTVEERKNKNAKRLLEIFEHLASENKTPEILIAQTFSSYINVSVLSEIRNKYGTLIVNIGMDDRHQYWKGTYDLIPHIDLALTAAPECVDWYLKENCPALFFPEASDLNIFHPMPQLTKVHDVSFVGAKYGIREKIVLALRAANIRVTTYGGGWGNGYLAVEEVPKLFAQSKIVLGVGTIGHSTDFYALKMRDFDGPMSGSCYLTHDNSDLNLLFEIDKEIVTYKTIDECVSKTQFYLARENERERIAKAGFERAKRDHTWEKRFHEMLDFILRE